MINSHRFIACMIILLSLIPGRATCRGLEPEGEYLSDSLADRIVSSTQGWGSLGFNTAVQPIGRPAMPLRIKDRTYVHGLGHHAAGEIVVDLAGQFATFKTDLGIQWQGGHTTGSVVFQVYVDDKKVFDSETVHESDGPRTLSIPVRAAQELRLVVTDAGDGIVYDCADWADARLIRDPSVKPVPAADVDIAPFGRVISWDPNAEDRNGGKPHSGVSESRPGAGPRDPARLRWQFPCPRMEWLRLHRHAMVREQAVAASGSGVHRGNQHAGAERDRARGLDRRIRLARPLGARQGQAGTDRKPSGLGPRATGAAYWHAENPLAFCQRPQADSREGALGVHAVALAQRSMFGSSQLRNGRPAWCRSNCTTVFSWTRPGSLSTIVRGTRPGPLRCGSWRV